MGLSLSLVKDTEEKKTTRSRDFHYSQLLKFSHISHDKHLYQQIITKCHPLSIEEQLDIVGILVDNFNHKILSVMLKNTLYIEHTDYSFFDDINNDMISKFGEGNPITIVIENYLRTKIKVDIV